MPVSFPGSKATLAATFLLAVSLLSACNVVIRDPAPQRPPQLGAVPAIEGMHLGRAEAALERAGFHLGRVTKETTRRAPSGTVLWQEPAPDTRAYRGTAVDVVLARQMAAVPKLRGLRLERAEHVLERAGFHLGQVTERVSDRARQGAVIGQSPAPSRLAELGSEVDLVVVARAQPAVPSLEGLSLKAARKSLRQAGLDLGEVTEKLTDRRPDGTVLRQRPRAARRVAPGTRVDLVIARPAAAAVRPAKPDVAVKPRQVPRLEGLSLKRAGKALKRAGLALGQVTERPTNKAPAGTVIRQDPRAESRAAPGTRVDLVIARLAGLSKPVKPAERAKPAERTEPATLPAKAAMARVPKLHGLSVKAARRALEGIGLRAGRITKGRADKGKLDSVVAQTPAAGTRIEAGTPVDLVIRGPEPSVSPARQGESAPNGEAKAAINPARADESPLNSKAKAPPRD